MKIRYFLFFIFLLFRIGKISANDSVKVAAGEQYKKNFLFRFLLGGHYRSVWNTRIIVPIMDLENMPGMLRPVKAGGGMQTVSVHLTDSSGKRFVLRGLDKKPERVLPAPFRYTFLRYLISDQTSAANPYAALVTSKLSGSAQIYHTNPSLYYISPNNGSLGAFGDDLSGIALFEEKPNSDWKGAVELNAPKAIVDTEKLIKKLLDDPKILVNQKSYLKCRLFDLIINDWDRHADQWAWLGFDKEGKTVFEPFPRDRDNAFYLFDDGLLPFLVSRWWGKPKLQSFHPFYENIQGLSLNALYLDRLFLNRLSPQDWNVVALELMEQLSDSAIINAIDAWPPEIQRQIGQYTVKTLISRRDRLPEAVEAMYYLVNRHIYIMASDHDDLIEIYRHKRHTSVSIYSATDSASLYTRDIRHGITQKISVYALEGDDLITIKGHSSDKGIKVIVYGDEGHDTIRELSRIRGWRKKTRFTDIGQNTIYRGAASRLKYARPTRKTTFNRNGQRN